MPRQWVVRDGQVYGFQPFDLVAQAGGFFEFQVLSSFAHVGAQPVQHGLQIAARQRVVDLGGHAALVGVALIQPRQHIFDVLFHRGRRNAVFFVIGDLLGAPPVGLGHCAFHRPGDLVRVHDHPAICVTRGPANGLHKRGFRAQKTLFVGVQNRHQPAFGNIKPLAQQVDPD